MAEQTRRLVLGGATAGVVTRCRDFTRRALADWSWAPGTEAEEDVLLLVSELVTNACLHAGGPRELVLRYGPEDRLRVEVTDGSPDLPRPRPAHDPARPGGHGLVLLDHLARAWGCALLADGRPGKTVWLELPASLPEPELPAPLPEP
ncbi:ATP-binding protein [Streptomyces sp. NPDC001272]|uniref:ATP-binding protein n=1 Tax=unclassified Streptomyces TaxID=2593676 RepID=UPI00332BECA4